MILGADIVTKLQSLSGVTAMVGTRIYSEYTLEADKIYPLIVFKKENVDTGSSYGGPTGLENADVILACMSTDNDEAESLASIILTQLNEDTSQWGSVWVQGCFLKEEGITEEVFEQETSEALNVYATILTFNVWYNAMQISSSSSGT